MEFLKSFVITLVTTMIFITAVELIAPDNSMKKYLKFVLGLILIVVILNPILKIFSSDENQLKSSIASYENKYKERESNESENIETNKLREESFKSNFNKNCENMLKNEFNNIEFKCESKCQVDFKGVTFKIDSIDIFLKEKKDKKDSKIKKIEEVEKVEIDTKSNKEKEDETHNNEYKEIVKFVQKELQIEEEKINIYKMK
ncbi:MAG: stage III sporulation protein AF [Clostridium sp.]|uniref:stage III sporulation protein AF n=1 Tax=Clostridium sp. TaxID=1506 RepID=UPI003F357A31